MKPFSNRLLIITLIANLSIIVRAQVVTPSESNIEQRVFYLDSWDKKESEYLYKIAYFANSYSKAFYKECDYPIYIRVIDINNYFKVKVDNHTNSYYTDILYNTVKEEEIGLYLIIPTTCVELSRIAKLLDLGFQNFNMLKECKSLIINRMKEKSPVYIHESECELSEWLIESALKCELIKKKGRYVHRFELKNNFECYSIN